MHGLNVLRQLHTAFQNCSKASGWGLRSVLVKLRLWNVSDW